MKSPDKQDKTLGAKDLRQLNDAAFRGRSAAYRYFRRNFAKLVREKVGTAEGPSWDEVAALMDRKGYQTVRGDVLNGNAVRRVFRRVEADLASATDARGKVAAKRLHRSRPDPNWQPAVLARAAPAPQRDSDDQQPSPGKSRHPVLLPGAERQPISEEEAKEAIARLQRTFRERSGH